MKSSTDRARPGCRTLVFPVLFVLLGLVIVEVCLQLARVILNAGKLSNRQYLLSPYRGQEWAKELFRESLATKFQFDPFLGFRERPFSGAHVNIDARGLRRTWNPDLPPGPRARSIFTFGGSTVWGWGARDDQTIPSCLSKLLWERGQRCLITNCGQKGYTSSQEIVQLTRLLRGGERPDVVVFYDGFNDVFFAYRAGHEGSPFDLEANRQKFEERELKLVARGLSDWIRSRSAIVSVASSLLSRLQPGERTRYGTRAPEYSDEALSALAARVAEDYCRTLDLLDHLAEAYGFCYECFWQPVVFYEERLTPEETEVGPGPGDRQAGRLFQLVQADLLAKRPHRFHDVTASFRGRTGTIYTDFAHVSEDGNRLVAARIGDILLGEGDLEPPVNRP